MNTSIKPNKEFMLKDLNQAVKLMRACKPDKILTTKIDGEKYFLLPANRRARIALSGSGRE